MSPPPGSSGWSEGLSTQSQTASRTPGTSPHLFVPAGFVPELPLSEQPALALRWRVTNAATAVAHHSGKVAILRHTHQPTGEILDLGFLLCLDTNGARGGWLTTLEVETGQVRQADRAGRLREDRRIVPVGRCRATDRS